MSRQDILTVTGRYYDFVNSNNKINRHDLIRGLSRICSFGGQLRDDIEFYSVAQHSVLVSYIVNPPFAYWALFHDAAEALIGDMVRPLKNLLPDYKSVEKKVEREVFDSLGLVGFVPDEVKKGDLILLATEQRDLMAPHDDEWASIAGIKPLPHRINPLNPNDAFKLFMDRLLEVEAIDAARGYRAGLANDD